MIRKKTITYFSRLEIKESSYSLIEHNKLDICSLWGDSKNQHYVNTGELFTAKFPVLIKKNGEVCELSILYIADYLNNNSDITGALLHKDFITI